MINIRNFINDHYLYLPQNKKGSSQYRLMRALQEKGYEQHDKNFGSNRKNMAFLNEERRRFMKLPPLTEVDYNNMERAAIKIKLIVDCLMLSRRMSGYTIVAKDLVIAQMLKQ
mmetsp:Transcript_31901/g.48883  ORF Transcript_31901/g.48883 Transcript_31901/m.48883 type:complete len:113 (-) Transcript_31901:4141-4479(-)